MTHLGVGEPEMIQKFVSPGDIVFDVGGFEGEWSALALTTKGVARSYIFEPNLDMYEQILQNMKAWIVKQIVIPIKFAVSDMNGEGSFWIYDSWPGMSTMHKRSEKTRMDAHLAEPTLVSSVPVIKLDTYCDAYEVSHIDFLKIDTEGNEVAVLKGAESLISKNAISTIQFEYGGCFQDAGRTLKEIFEFLGLYGYKIARVHPEILNFSKFAPELENYEYSNYIAVL